MFILILILFMLIVLQRLLFTTSIAEAYDHFWDSYQSGCDVNNKAYKRPGKLAINNLHESLTTGTSRHCTDCDGYLYHGVKNCNECNKLAPFLGIDQPCGPCKKSPKQLSPELQSRIVLRQPCFLDNGADIKEYYDRDYYNDLRYPVRPIPVEFAKDPEGYCAKNSESYPCYVRYSRHDLK